MLDYSAPQHLDLTTAELAVVSMSTAMLAMITSVKMSGDPVDPAKVEEIALLLDTLPSIIMDVLGGTKGYEDLLNKLHIPEDTDTAVPNLYQTDSRTAR